MWNACKKKCYARNVVEVASRMNKMHANNMMYCEQKEYIYLYKYICT